MTTQPAGEHHTGTLNLAGEGNAPSTPISDEATTQYPADLQRYEIVELAAARMSSVAGIYYIPQTSTDPIYDQLARAALEALEPVIRQHVAEQIAAKANEIAEQFQATAISHRDLSHEHGRTIKGTSHMNTAHAYRNKADGAWAVAHAAREIGGGQ